MVDELDQKQIVKGEDEKIGVKIGRSFVIKRKKLKDELNGILAGMSDADEHEVAEKIRRLTFAIEKIKRKFAEKKDERQQKLMKLKERLKEEKT